MLGEVLISSQSRGGCNHRYHNLVHLRPQKSTLRPGSRHFIEIGDLAIDEKRILGWASFCDSNHRGGCHGLSPLHSMEFPSSLTFVDVMSSCLAKGDGTVKYLALSYVWGDRSDTLELNRTTARKLFDVGVLGLPDVENQIPKTIGDAMQLTKKLGIRYLWVDRLCIVSHAAVVVSGALAT